MPLPDIDSSVGHSFGLELDGIAIKALTEVSGLKMEQDVIEVKQNTPDGEYVVRKLPGRWKSGECTLTRGLTADDGFDKWIQEVQLGGTEDARKSGSIIVYDFEGTPIKRYKLTHVRPKSLEIATLKAGDTSVLTEKLVLTYERLEVE